MLESPLGCSIVRRACDKGLAEIHVHNLRDYSTGRYRKVDDYPFGGEGTERLRRSDLHRTRRRGV